MRWRISTAGQAGPPKHVVEQHKKLTHEHCFNNLRLCKVWGALAIPPETQQSGVGDTLHAAWPLTSTTACHRFCQEKGLLPA